MITRPRRSDPPRLLLWALLPGALGFLAGFLGPAILDPESNQGPLLGIFFTGPGGALLGLMLGAACRVLGIPPVPQWWLLSGVCAVWVAGTLLVSLPGPKLLGTVIDAKIEGCKPPARALDRAIAFWEKNLAGTTARPGWQDDLRRTAQADPGVVLELRVTRQLRIFEHRKPWDKGRITTTGWNDVSLESRYYTRDAGVACGSYAIGTRVLRYAYYPPPLRSGGKEEWPPTSNLPRFLDLRILTQVPEEYRRFIAASEETGE